MRLITQKEVLHELSITRTTLHRMRRNGDFIREVRISPRKIAFMRADFDNWLEGRTIH